MKSYPHTHPQIKPRKTKYVSGYCIEALPANAESELEAFTVGQITFDKYGMVKEVLDIVDVDETLVKKRLHAWDAEDVILSISHRKIIERTA